MTAQELAQQILAIAQRALEQENRVPIYLDEVPDIGFARSGLEAIIKLCREVQPSQESFRHYQKKEH
jgi:hypothetical protein